MARNDEKTRTAFWLDKELLARCDTCWKANGYSSRNEFVNRAIEHYITQVTLDKADEVMVNSLSKAIAKATDDSAVKISKGLFRYAVGQEMILRILARQFGIRAEQVDRLRGQAIKSVRSTRGKVSLEAIADFEAENKSAAAQYAAQSNRKDTYFSEDKLLDMLHGVAGDRDIF